MTPRRGARSDELVLDARNVKVIYGGLVAVDDVSLRVAAGEVVGLIGPNGAGKTTFVDALTGFAPASGEVLLCGAGVDGLRPHRRAQLGLSRTWQSIELFDDLTVAENLFVPTEKQAPGALFFDLVHPGKRTGGGERARAALEVLGMADAADRYPRELSHGQQKLVGVARALVSRPKLLCMDEPAAGLDTDESRVLAGRIRKIADDGVAVLVIDHDMDLVMSTCDHLYVLDFGRIIADGTAAEIQQSEHVIAAYLGDQEDRPVQSDASVRATRPPGVRS